MPLALRLSEKLGRSGPRLQGTQFAAAPGDCATAHHGGGSLSREGGGLAVAPWQTDQTFRRDGAPAPALAELSDGSRTT